MAKEKPKPNKKGGIMSEEISLHSESGYYDYFFEIIKDEDNLKVLKLNHDGFSSPDLDKLPEDPNEMAKQIIDDPQGSFKPCKCVHGVEIIRKGKKVKVILSELPENGTGTSITNMYEDIANIVYDEFLKNIKPKNITWIEYYPYLKRKDRYGFYDDLNSGELYSKVQLDYERPGRFNREVEFSKPRWKKIKRIKSFFQEKSPYPKSSGEIKKLSWWTRRKLLKKNGV